MAFIILNQWQIFISIELLSLVMLLLFGIFRYLLDKQKISRIFIVLFIGLLLSEAVLGLFVYRQTGEISTFIMILIVFLVYACTFGVFDFLRLDRWMRVKIGKLRGVDLLTDKDKRLLIRNKDPKYIAKKYRISSFIHLIVFVIGQAILWTMGTEDLTEMFSYMTDLSWVSEEDFRNSPYANETFYGIGMIWGIAFIADFVYSWSYTLFPGK